MNNEDATRTPALAYIVVVGFLLVAALVVWQGLPTDSREVAVLMLGNLGAAFLAVIGWRFGTSSSSERKTELLARATPSVEPSVGDAEKDAPK